MSGTSFSTNLRPVARAIATVLSNPAHEITLRPVPRGEIARRRARNAATLAVEVLEDSTIDRLPGFKKRMDWFLKYRPELARHISYMQHDHAGGHGDAGEGHRLLAIPSRDRLEAVGLRFAGMSPDGSLPEIVEVPDHPWFIGVQFHPELKSKPFDPHPLFRGFIGAAVRQGRLV